MAIPIIGPAGYPGVRYNDRTEDAACFEFDSTLSFNYEGIERKLELELLQTRIDGANHPYVNNTMPLEVLLIEEFQEDGVPHRYEDVYYFTHDGDFMNHLYRGGPSGEFNEERDRFTPDQDMSKLHNYGKQIQRMLRGHQLHPSLEEHPTVKRLKDPTPLELSEAS